MFRNLIKNNHGEFSLIDSGSNDCFIIAEEPWWIFRANSRVASLEVNGKKSNISGDILSEFNRVLKEFAFSRNSKNKIAIGYLSYDLVSLIEEIFQKNHNEPLIYFAGFKKYGTIKKSYIYYKLQNKSKNYFNFQTIKLRNSNTLSFEDYKEKIKMIKKYIEEGEVYQVNFSERQTFDFSGNPLELYLRLSKIARPAHGFYLDTGKLKVLSLSPERFFRIRGEIIGTFPIKGTIHRGRTKAEDVLNMQRLLGSEKDHAEHLMIVDLLRNDLGRICKIGSIKVDKLFSIRSFRTVHHMVTNIYGKLKKNIGFDDIIRAIFPGGSITGAPKIRAMQVIEEIEDYRRGIYTGAIGYLLPDGSADFNIAIRTMLIDGERAYYSAGGGIVYDSDPEKEFEEILTKTKIINLMIEELRNEENLFSERKVAY